jgi:Ser/Thr protein kinase RdoA (MazF antagonist)
VTLTDYSSAAWKALESFPVKPKSVELVAHSENLTFRVVGADSETDYALRLHRPGYNSLEELNSERLWVAQLEKTGLSVQHSLKTHAGRYFEMIEIPDTGERRFAGLTTWLDGTPLSCVLDSTPDTEDRQRIFYEIGKVAGALHNQSEQWTEPRGFTRRHLDIDGLLGDAPEWGRFWEHEALEPAEQMRLLALRDSGRDALEAYGSNDSIFGLIHADLHPQNIVHDGTSLGVIDFDDSAYGWHLYDLASALFDNRLSPDFESLRRALLDGYGTLRSLDSRMLDTFLRIRGMAIIGWYHQRPEHSESVNFESVKNWVLDSTL